jgi:hypothetical protein
MQDDSDKRRLWHKITLFYQHGEITKTVRQQINAKGADQPTDLSIDDNIKIYLK